MSETFDSELMAAARESWHKFYLQDGGKDHVDSMADALYEAYLAGFRAGRAVPDHLGARAEGEK